MCNGHCAPVCSAVPLPACSHRVLLVLPAEDISRDVCIQPPSASYSSPLPSLWWLLTHNVFHSTDRGIYLHHGGSVLGQMVVKEGAVLHHPCLMWDTVCVPSAHCDSEQHYSWAYWHFSVPHWHREMLSSDTGWGLKASPRVIAAYDSPLSGNCFPIKQLFYSVQRLLWAIRMTAGN